MPRRGDLPEQVLAGGDYDFCLWVPYPHQNFGVLAREIDDPRAYLAAAAEAAELPPPDIPRFGPFALPPARELVVARDRTGERFLVAARVYPLLAGVARLAGWLGSNPWLAGGEARSSGRPVRVRWQGSLWTVESGAGGAGVGKGAPPGADASRPAPAERDRPGRATPGAERSPALARLAVRGGFGPLPAGEYRLHRLGAGLEVRGGEVATEEAPPGLAAEVAALAFASGRSAEGSGRASRALALFAAGGRLGLPGMASLHRGGRERWKLPGEGLLGFLAGELPAGEAAGWEIVALDEGSFRRAAALAPGLTGLERREVRLALRLDPGAAHRMVAEVAAVLEAVPIVGARHARRWRRWEVLLAPLAGRRELTVVIGSGPAEARALLR